MMSLLEDFKKFAMRGNVLDMAVGVIIGAAFGKIVTSLVNNIIMPPIGKIVGNIDFNNLFINLSDTPVSTLAEATKLKIPVSAYGAFLTQVIDFIIIAFAIFMMIKALNKLKKPAEEAAAPAEPSAEEKLLTEIRDLLKK